MKDQNPYSRQVQVSSIKSLFDDIIDRHAEAYISAYPEVKEFGNFEDKSGTYNYYIGMVWACDFEKPSQQDATTIRVRGSKAIANNKLVELDLNNVIDQLIHLKTQESFFPGQVIAFKAEPFLNKQLSVTKILDPIKIAPQMKSLHTRDKIVLAAASGPFMKADQDDWTLYDKIIENVKEHAVSHLILTGPFVDMANKFSKANYEAQWRMFMEKLIEELHDHDCHIYIVPSSKDILPSYLQTSYTYPCPKLTLKLGVKEGAVIKCKIHYVTDPAQIDIDGLHVDVTSADVAFQMSQCLWVLNKVDTMLSTVFRHLIIHGIYPIYPSHPEMAVDYPELRQYIQLDRLGPHIMVLPNQFVPSSVHSVEGRLVVSMKKCSLGKQLIVLEIPPTSDCEGQVNSIADSSRHTSKIIDLIPKTQTIVDGTKSIKLESDSSEALCSGEEVAPASTDSGDHSPSMAAVDDTR